MQTGLSKGESASARFSSTASAESKRDTTERQLSDPSFESSRSGEPSGHQPRLAGGDSGSRSVKSGSRRYAIQEQSLERDAALSLRARELKHKRTSSIKSALKHAHLGALRVGGEKRASDKQASAGQPYELFEPPVTQRAFQRSKRRGAMMSADPKRQMSADTIGLRQLTDEYLANAGVKPLGSSDQCNLVSLVPPRAQRQHLLSQAGSMGTLSQVGGSGGSSAGHQSGLFGQHSMETKLYQASKQLAASKTASKEDSRGSQESLSQVSVLPGNLPWQSDVSIQCQLLAAPPLVEPYESTGDILNTIAGPFRGNQLASSGQPSGNQLSATLKRGLSAISSHHLSPSAAAAGVPAAAAALNVVGCLKKSLSNTLDISLASARTSAMAAHLHSQDSLPAYASLRNEPDEPEAAAWTELLEKGQQAEADQSGLIGQLASKLGRQSSRKFSVSKKGLQRALSFDCRGYKRLDASQHSQLLEANNGANNYSSSAASRLSAEARQVTQNKSTLALNTDYTPRPYLAQSASQVDFQVPLLPFAKMQEAIVSQRLLDPSQRPNSSSLEPTQQAADEEKLIANKSLDVDELLCSTGNVNESQQSAANYQEQLKTANQDSASRESSSAQTANQQLEELEKRSAKKRTSPAQLVLNVPARDEKSVGNKQVSGRSKRCASQLRMPNEDELEPEEEPEGWQTSGEQDKSTVIVCLPSPNVSIDPEFNLLNQSAFQAGKQSEHLLVSDLLTQSSQLLKRASTMISGNAVDQVTQALSSAGAPTLRNRRQAIVPPKLATDSHQSDSESAEQRPDTAEGQLVELACDEQQTEDGQCKQLTSEEEIRLKSLRRKRSGGTDKSQRPDSGARMSRRLSESLASLPTFCIEQDQQEQRDEQHQNRTRPESQMTNVESLASSGSSTNLSLVNQQGSAGNLLVPFGNSQRSHRRRSSSVIIPHMQTCPGDLIVYSKQLLDRMFQPQDLEPPHFLTIEDKKGKSSVWNSFKLCAQFDSRSLRARNELLCSLEDVLSSLQPSTFVDLQLSHYKGMSWDEFIYETESRRSASSGGVSANDDEQAETSSMRESHLRSKSVRASSKLVASDQCQHESLKATTSSGCVASESSRSPVSPMQRSRDSTCRSISSRFKEKPRLKRGQTVDSVFRIPLIPSSPLKHAQLHQQTPTAHLEDHNQLITIEDEDRSSPSATESRASSREPSVQRHHRARPGSVRSTRNNAGHAHKTTDQDQDSSFEEATDLQQVEQERAMKRQSSLSTISSTITRTEQKRQRALWDLFQSECNFFFDHLMTLKNVFMEPLKKIQVEGFTMSADPDVLFGNLDELCCGVYDFCKEFLQIIKRTLKTRPEELNATDVLIKLYKKNPKIDHLRGVYHRYTLNYINALTYLDSLRRQVDFSEFEKWASRDVRCKKLSLTDLLVAPVQHIMRVPIILKDIESHTENVRDRDEIRAILAVEEASLRELDDKMRWLKNFERLLEIQKNISWPSVLDMEPKLFVPEFIKEILSKQPCEKLIVSPRRQIVYEGTLCNFDFGKCDMHVILFEDMLLMTRRKKGLTKKASTVCKTNSGNSSNKDDGSFKYIVYKQPLTLDRFTVHDVQQVDAQAIGMKHLFLLIVWNRFQQIINVHSFSAPNDDIKQTWLFKIKKTEERWTRNLSKNPAEQEAQQSHHVEFHIDQQPKASTSRQPTPVSKHANQSELNNRTAQGSTRLIVNGSADQPIEFIVTSASGHSNDSSSCYPNVLQ